MKKLFTSAILTLAAAAVSPANGQEITYEDYAGAYVCTVAEGITGSYDYDGYESWLGHKMKVTVRESNWDYGKIDLNLDNFFPQGYYNEQGMYLRMDDTSSRSGYVISKTSYVGSYNSKKAISTSDPNCADLDVDCDSWTYPAGTPDGIKDLVITWAEDLNSFTVENLSAAYEGGDQPFTAAKIVYEKSLSPNYPSLSAQFNLATGGNDITINLPSTYDYDSGYGQITKNLDKVVLERSFDYGSTYTPIKEWTNSDESALEPGATLNYSDTDFDFDNLTTNYFYYKATVYLGNSSSNSTTGTSVGINAPQVQNLKAETGEKGELPVIISFNLPSEEELTLPLTKVEICRYDNNTNSDVVLQTITEDLTADRLITYEDKDAANNDRNNYRIYTYWKYGKGQSNASVYVGQDVPGPVDNFNIKPESADKLVITWDAPTKGTNGGYIDPTATHFKLTRRLSTDYGKWIQDSETGNYDCVYTTLVVLAEDITETTFTDVYDGELDGLYQFYYTLYTFVEGQEDPTWAAQTNGAFGTDQPSAPSNLKADVNVNDVTLTWEVPTAGQSGGWYDPAKVLYKITRRLTNDTGVYNYDTWRLEYPSLVEVATDITETTYVDKLDIEYADSYFYEVYAYSQDTQNPYCTSVDVIVGPKNGVGFNEGFESKDGYGYCAPERFWEINSTSYDGAQANDYVYYNFSDVYKEKVGEDESGDPIYNQFFIFKNYGNDSYYGGKFTADVTPYTFDLSDTDLPVVLYRVLMLPTENNGQLSICGGSLAEGQTLADLQVFATESNYDPEFALEDDEPAWRDCVALLPDLAGNDDCLINLHYETGEVGANRAFFAIDDIEVRDYKAPVLTTESTNTADEKQHTLTWTDPSTNDLLVEYFEIYRTKTQKTGVQDDVTVGYTEVYPEAELGNEFELIATLADADYATTYVDNMFAEDGKTFDATQHIYKVVAVYSDPVEIKSSSKPVQVSEGVTTGIGSINVGNAATRYYNLQGQRIASPAKGQIVIEVKDGKATKIVR